MDNMVLMVVFYRQSTDSWLKFPAHEHDNPQEQGERLYRDGFVFQGTSYMSIKELEIG